MTTDPIPTLKSVWILDPGLSAGGAFLRSVGLQIDRVAPDEVLAHLEATEEHHTPWGLVHGGLYTTVIESVATIGAVAAVQHTGQVAVGVNNQTDFLAASSAGPPERARYPHPAG